MHVRHCMNLHVVNDLHCTKLLQDFTQDTLRFKINEAAAHTILPVAQ